METIAVYWEDRIKTYGFTEAAGLSLIQWQVPVAALSDLGLGMEDLGGGGIRMLLVLGQAAGDRGTAFGLLVERRWEERILRRLQDILGEGARESVRGRSPAGLIHFHGPHFGDRYGIADAALRAIEAHGISILGMGCSSSSIYLVLAEADMASTRTALLEAFLRPEP